MLEYQQAPQPCGSPIQQPIGHVSRELSSLLCPICPICREVVYLHERNIDWHAHSTHTVEGDTHTVEGIERYVAVGTMMVHGCMGVCMGV
jgi:hypothetical protein